jgi:DNA repair exonuclease SbcCD ATPase subunit
MSKPRWKAVAATLKASKAQNEYADSLAAVDPRTSIQQELLEEMSESLNRSAQKIREALIELDELDEQLDGERNLQKRKELVDAFNEKRREALEARRNYTIQREAIGFHRNSDIEKYYPIPPKRRTVIGVHGEDGRVDECADE